MERLEKKSVLTQDHLNLENKYQNFLTGVHNVCTEEAASKWTPLTLHPAAEKNFSNSDIHTFRCSRIVLWFDKNETFLNPSSKVLLLGYQNQPNGPPLTHDIILADTIPEEMHTAGGNQFNYLFLEKANKWLKRAPSLCTEACVTQSVTLICSGKPSSNPVLKNHTPHSWCGSATLPSSVWDLSYTLYFFLQPKLVINIGLNIYEKIFISELSYMSSNLT